MVSDGSPQADRKRDKWAEWLLHGRRRGMSEVQLRKAQRYLTRVRDRVLREAKLQPGERVVDLGAGTGLLALEARRPLREAGYVLALDLSFDALAECRRQVGAAPHGAPIECAVADAGQLPLGDQCVDVVMMRSVLIYVVDKPTAIRELYRVLKPGGRVSLFEPINEINDRASQRVLTSGVYDALQPEWGLIRDYYDAHKAQWGGPLIGWDEGDLSSWFADAGFSTVTVSYEFTAGRQTRKPRKADILAGILVRPNPNMPSYEEVVRAVLGEGADSYLQRVVRFRLDGQGPSTPSAFVYLVAKR